MYGCASMVPGSRESERREEADAMESETAAGERQERTPPGAGSPSQRAGRR